MSQQIFQNGNIDSHLHRSVQVAPDSEHAHLLMHVYSAAISTQMHSSAADRRIADLERQVSRVTSDLQDVQGDRQSYDRLKLRLDL